jgi:hypothetical protein
MSARSRVVPLFASLVLGTLSVAAGAQHEKGSCTAEGGWADCPEIKVDLEPVVLGGEEVKAKTPTALIFSALKEGGQEHLIVADKDGDVIAYDMKSGAGRTLLSIPDIASINPERGLLGFALHPEFVTNPQRRRFYSYHTIPRSNEANAKCKRIPPGVSKKRLVELCAIADEYGCGGNSLITEWTVTDIDGGDPSKSLVEKVILKRLQPGEGHNAGHLLFGPDGMLYASFGDGGAQQDPCGRGQDTSKVQSTILRMNVDGDDLTPEDNPFVGKDGHDPLIWAYGFRNPWRMDFAPEGIDSVAAGTLFVGDTGQARLEEINVIVKGGNYGWSVREGTLDHPHVGPDAPADVLNPLYEYGNPKARPADSGGFAIVGGVVHAGDDFPALRGMYVFGDNVKLKLYALDLSASKIGDSSAWDGKGKVHELGGATIPAATFARDSKGEVYVGASDGNIRKIVPKK